MNKTVLIAAAVTVAGLVGVGILLGHVKPAAVKPVMPLSILALRNCADATAIFIIDSTGVIHYQPGPFTDQQKAEIMKLSATVPPNHLGTFVICSKEQQSDDHESETTS